MRADSARQLTIVFVPREKFSFATESLTSVLRDTTCPFRLVCVDGGAPAAVAANLEAMTKQVEGIYLRSPGFLYPNEARNLAMQYVETPFVAFVDNDLVVTRGWEQPLLKRLKDETTVIASPLYLEGWPGNEVVHMARGTFVRESGTIRVKQEYLDEPYLEVKDKIEGGYVDCGEFHCVMLKTKFIEEIGGFDLGLKTTREHVDIALEAAKRAYRIYFEPDSIVSYIPGPLLQVSDLPFYLFRWGERATVKSIAHFEQKWNLKLDEGRRKTIRDRRLGALATTATQIAGSVPGMMQSTWFAAKGRFNRTGDRFGDRQIRASKVVDYHRATP